MNLKKNIILNIMIKKNINYLIDNIITIQKYKNIEEFKINIIDGIIIEDERYYLKGIRRYLDNSSYYNNLNIRNLIINTYHKIANNIQIPIKENNIKIYQSKLKLYILYLDSLQGLRNLCKKYEIEEEYIYIMEKIVPEITTFMKNLEKDYF